LTGEGLLVIIQRCRMEAGSRGRAGFGSEAGASGHPLAGREGARQGESGEESDVHLNNRTERGMEESNAGSSGNGFSASRVSE